MNICFLITTYNRQRSCQRLVDSLQGLGDIVVAHDGTDYEIKGAINLNPKTHYGKTGYWKLINMLYKNRTNCKFYFTLPDDFIISETQIMEAVRLWESIRDPYKICLSIAEGRPNHTCWTGFKAVNMGDIWLTQWVDMCFICDNNFFRVLGEIPPLFPRSRGITFHGSSRVGAYISKRMFKRKFNMYQVDKPLVKIQEEHHTSQMHK